MPQCIPIKDNNKYILHSTKCFIRHLVCLILILDLLQTVNFFYSSSFFVFALLVFLIKSYFTHILFLTWIGLLNILNWDIICSFLFSIFTCILFLWRFGKIIVLGSHSWKFMRNNIFCKTGAILQFLSYRKCKLEQRQARLEMAVCSQIRL
jgi:hypothetical protein